MLCFKQSFCQIIGCKIGYWKYFIFLYLKNDKLVKIEFLLVFEIQLSNMENDN